MQIFSYRLKCLSLTMSIHRWSPSWSGKPSESNDDFVIFEHYHSFTLRSDFFFVNFQAAKREIDLNVLLCLWSPWWLSFNICRVWQRLFLIGHFQTTKYYMKWASSFDNFNDWHFCIFNLTKCWEVTEFILLFVKCWAMSSAAAVRSVRTE